MAWKQWFHAVQTNLSNSSLPPHAQSIPFQIYIFSLLYINIYSLFSLYIYLSSHFHLYYSLHSKSSFIFFSFSLHPLANYKFEELITEQKNSLWVHIHMFFLSFVRVLLEFCRILFLFWVWLLIESFKLLWFNPSCFISQWNQYGVKSTRKFYILHSSKDNF